MCPDFKKVIDNKGIFQIFVPITWRYWMMEEQIHSFEDNEIVNDSGCFQLSLTLLNESERIELAKALGYLQENKIGDFDCRSHQDSVSHDGYVTKAWSTIYGYYHVYFTYTYATSSQKTNYEDKLQNRLKVIYAVFATFYIIQDNERERIVTSYRFEMFLQGIGTTNLLLSKAIENKAFFEATCLLGNQIDSLLRIGIILKRQILNNNDLIEQEWIYQGSYDKKKSEKDVYKIALAISVITDDLYKSLFELYEDRNRVIHRFIISEITLSEVEEIAYNYYFLREDIKVIINDIESEQLKLNIGMITVDEDDKGNRSSELKNILGKIGTLRYFLDQKTPRE